MMAIIAMLMNFCPSCAPCMNASMPAETICAPEKNVSAL